MVGRLPPNNPLPLTGVVMTVFRGMKVSESARQLSWVVTLVAVPKSQSFSRNIIKPPLSGPPGSSEILNRFSGRDRGAENSIRLVGIGLD
jgi:hypothetical protein